MKPLIDPLAPTVIVDVRGDAVTRDMSIAHASEPETELVETELATTFWVAHAPVQETEVALVPAPSIRSVPPRPRPFVIAAGLVAVLCVIVVTMFVRVRSERARATTTATQPEVPEPASQSSVTSSTMPTVGDAPVALAPHQLEALETEAATALFAADESTALVRYRALAAGGDQIAQRVVTLLERP